jgi:hypothetical protein
VFLSEQGLGWEDLGEDQEGRIKRSRAVRTLEFDSTVSYVLDTMNCSMSAKKEVGALP